MIVKEHDVRFHGECACDGDALLLPAGEAVGVLLGLRGHSDALQQFHPVLVGGPGAPGLHLAQRQGDVVEHGQVGEEVVVLEDDADAGPPGARAVLRVLPQDGHGASNAAAQALEDLDGGGLARAVGP